MVWGHGSMASRAYEGSEMNWGKKCGAEIDEMKR